MTVVIDGTLGVTTPSETITGGTANGVAYLNGSKVLTTGSALTFDGANSFLGIGPGVTPSKSLTIYNPSIDTEMRLQTGTKNFYLSQRNSSGQVDYIVVDNAAQTWSVNNSEAMRLTSTGLGIGTSSPNYRLDVAGTANAIALGTTLAYGTGGEVYSAFRFNNSSFSGGNSEIRNIVNGTESTGSTLAFFTTQTGSGPLTERLRIDSSGNLLVGTTSTGAYQDGRLNVVGAGSQPAITGTISSTASTQFVYSAWSQPTSGNNQFMSFETETTPVVRGSISYNRGAGLVAYNVTSDYRAKDIIGPVADSGALIDSVPVYTGKMKGATQERPMFIAHEVPAYAHTGEKDAVDADGNPVYQQMDASALVPVMWAEIQSLRKRLTALEQK